ncbi:MAG: type II toxin-antitoxin system YafQ family toxin [Holophagaceae bacterium]|nr:type II toxin-antitoxin system YafQ family toxin [Holophagaceae bacterium]
MLQIVLTTRMKRDIKIMAKRNKDLTQLQIVLNLLASGIPLPRNYKDHQLKGGLILGCV